MGQIFKVAKITVEQKDLLVDQELTPDQYFNPIELPAPWGWVISKEEIDACDNPEFSWVHSLTIEDYEAPDE